LVVLPALTVRQPWADAIAYAGKTPENRGWQTGYRGPLPVHAGQRWDPAGEAAVRRLLGPAGAGLLARARRRLGVVVAVVDLVDVHEDRGGCCGPWAAGRWHWTLADPRPLVVPAPARGRLGLWPWTPPPGLPRRVRRSRRAGARLPAGAVCVTRPGRWGNPFTGPAAAETFCAFLAARRAGAGGDVPYPSDEQIRDELGGRVLACWCALDRFCHCDVLLAVANDAEAIAAPRGWWTGGHGG
jgi:hypothetical protein